MGLENFEYESFTNKSLCVTPTEGETQFEAFQSILAAILYANNPPVKTFIKDMSPYEYICYKNKIILTTTIMRDSNNTYIYFDGEEVTHYKAIVNGQILDPYKFFQPKNTQGFCQMFAFLLATGDYSGLYQINPNKRITDVELFKQYFLNTYECLQKILKLLSKKDDFYTKCESVFKKLDKGHYGIKPNCSFDKYLKDCSSLRPLDAALYIYDQPLPGYQRYMQPRKPLQEYIEQNLFQTILYP